MRQMIGPVGLALMVGASDVITPNATLDAIVPSFMYFTAWMALCGCAFLFFGFETGKQSLTTIDAELEEVPADPAVAVGGAGAGSPAAGGGGGGGRGGY